ncbi:MAG: hypothetical protein AMXMBFR81_18440 [Chthonomonas sp.]
MGSGFQLLVVQCDSVARQREAMKRLWPRVRYRVARVEDAERPLVDQVLQQVGRGRAPVMVTGLERLAFPGAEELGMWQNLNITRPRWARELPRTVVFWVTAEAHRLLATRAPDLYRFRATTIDLALPKSTEEGRVVELLRRIGALQASPATRLRWLIELWRRTRDDQAVRPMLIAACQGGGLLPEDVLSGLADLQVLDLWGAGISDVSPLSGLADLQNLNLGATHVSDLSPLAGLLDLHRLDLSFTSPSNLSPLSGLAALRNLHLTGTPVSDVSPLSGLKSLEGLFLGGTSVADASPLAGLVALRALSLHGTQVSDVSPLSGLTALEWLDLEDTPILDVRPLSGLKALRSLWLRGTQVSPEAVEELRRALPECDIVF